MLRALCVRCVRLAARPPLRQRHARHRRSAGHRRCAHAHRTDDAPGFGDAVGPADKDTPRGCSRVGPPGDGVGPERRTRPWHDRCRSCHDNSNGSCARAQPFLGAPRSLCLTPLRRGCGAATLKTPPQPLRLKPKSLASPQRPGRRQVSVVRQDRLAKMGEWTPANGVAACSTTKCRRDRNNCRRREGGIALLRRTGFSQSAPGAECAFAGNADQEEEGNEEKERRRRSPRRESKRTTQNNTPMRARSKNPRAEEGKRGDRAIRRNAR